MQTETKELPILFNAAMVRAILEGSKTQTRRVVKPQPLGPCRTHFDSYACTFSHWDRGYESDMATVACPLGKPGDRLWVKEKMFYTGNLNHMGSVRFSYAADCQDPELTASTRKTCGARDLKKTWSRILLEVTDVRVERVDQISESDARAEGITDGGCLNCGKSEPCGCPHPEPDAIDAFIYLWDSVAKPGERWDDNPWVWAVTFRVLDQHGQEGGSQ